MNSEKNFFFFIGTEAELIKVFPVIIECKKSGLKYHIIASGQNDIINSRIMEVIDRQCVELELSVESSIKKNAVGLLQWWLKTILSSKHRIIERFKDVDFSKAYMIVHGDTVSTFMGALIGKNLGMTVCHIEAGLRSHHLFNPFPEEIDRLLTSKIARIHFAPGEAAFINLKKSKGKVVNTEQNTLIDSLYFSYQVPLSEDIKSIVGSEYFVFVMHRQENLTNKNLVKASLAEMQKAAQTTKCVLILHQITKNVFISMGVYDDLASNKNIIMVPRVNYFDFMKLLRNSNFVITDGGSNQEELYYMGKPCLIMRKTTERKEGLGLNAKLYGGDISEIKRFIDSYTEYAQPEVKVDVHPSQIIVDSLIRYGNL